MRSLWKGSISFGLVTIPVKLYAATEDRDVKFNYLHEPCQTPVRYQKVCPRCGREVEMAEIVRGYEYEPGKFVVIRDEDVAALPMAAAHTLEIVDFVHLAEIDPIYFARTYYLEPGEGGGKAYALLRRALEVTGRIAVARVVIRSREHLAAIRTYRDGVLAAATMHWPDEIRSAAGLAGADLPVRDDEVAMAVSLVGSLSSGDFAPERFLNQYRSALHDLIQQRVAGNEVVLAEAAPPGKVIDLMEALRASIRQAEGTWGQEGALPRGRR